MGWGLEGLATNTFGGWGVVAAVVVAGGWMEEAVWLEWWREGGGLFALPPMENSEQVEQRANDRAPAPAQPSSNQSTRAAHAGAQRTLNTWKASNWMLLELSFSRFIISIRLRTSLT